MKKLKPCPFCGHKKPDLEKEMVLSHRSHLSPNDKEPCYSIECGNRWMGIKNRCGTSVGDYDTKEEAIKAWNRRPK